MGAWDIRCISERRLDDEAAQAKMWRDEGLDYARDHAGRLPAVAAVRLLRVWDLWQPRRQVMFAEGREQRVTQAGLVVYFLLCALAIAGALALRRRGRLAARSCWRPRSRSASRRWSATACRGCGTASRSR